MTWKRRDFSKVVEHVPIGIAVTTPDGVIEYANPHLCRLLESPVTFLQGTQLAHLQIATAVDNTGETQYQTGSSQVCHVLESVHPLRDDEGSVTHFVHFLQDFGPIKLAEQLTAMAFHDALTGLPNRNLFDERLSRAIAQAQRNGGGFALLYADVDRFKEVNDTCGHAGGDELLRQLADRMRQSVRKTDTVARLGGDEFAIILEQTASLAHVVATTEKLLARCCGDYDLEGMRLPASISIGISVYPRDASNMEELLRCADAAMYRAKTAGRNGYRINEPAGHYDVTQPVLPAEPTLRPA